MLTWQPVGQLSTGVTRRVWGFETPKPGKDLLGGLTRPLWNVSHVPERCLVDMFALETFFYISIVQVLYAARTGTMNAPKRFKQVPNGKYAFQNEREESHSVLTVLRPPALV
jgi:hypothetical protein